MARNLVARGKLIAQMVEARRRRCLVIQGPPGCGKTTTVVAYLQALLPLGFRAAWLELEPGDNEQARLLDQLLLSLDELDPDITHEAVELVGRGMDSASMERTVVALVRGIARHAGELVLVLDDLQHLTNIRVSTVLQWLLDYAPPNLHFILCSRSSMPISLARLRSQGQVLELDLRDLRFSSEESERFLKAQLGKIGKRDALTLHELTDGWVAGLQLYAVDLKKRRLRSAAEVTLPRNDENVYVQDAQTFAAYFEREVLSLLTPNEVELLVSVSACKRFCASLCAVMAGRDDAVAEVVALLERLESDNLFILPVASGEPEIWYRLHPLLRETLRERLGRRSEARQRQLHQAAWHWFRTHDRLEEAIAHAVPAGEAVAAAELLEREAYAMAVSGNLRKLVSLLRQLPPAQQSSPMLRIWMIRVDLYAHNFDACTAGIASLRSELPANETAMRFTLTMLEANLAVQRDDTDAAMALVPQLQHAPADADMMALGSRDNILSWLYMHRGEHERARQIQRNDPQRLVNGVPLLGTPSGTLQGRCLIGLSHAMQGDMSQAERIYRDVLHEAALGGSACSVPAHLATALLSEVLYEINEPDAVLGLVGEQIDVLERVSIPDSVLRLLHSLSASHWLAGRELEAFAYLDRLEDYATELGLDRLLVYSLTEQVQRRDARGQLETANALLQRVDAIVKRHATSAQKTSDEIPVIAGRARIRWLIALGDVHAAIEHIDQLMDWMRSRGRRRLFAQLLLMRAVVETRRGFPAKARQCVIEALRNGHSLGLVRSLLDADPAALDLIREAGADPAIDPVLAFYAERLLVLGGARSSCNAKAAPQDVLPLPIDLLSERELEIVRLLSQALPNKKIARALGVSPETVKWHLKNIFVKLGVTGRDEVVARVRDHHWADSAAR